MDEYAKPEQPELIFTRYTRPFEVDGIIYQAPQRRDSGVIRPMFSIESDRLDGGWIFDAAGWPAALQPI